MAEKTTVSKNKTAAVGKYSYKYTDLAQIHEEMERQSLRYFQHIETDNGVDYMVTTLMTAEGEVIRQCRGCRVVDANGQNPTQEHGKAITYARRYSLLMALGWATDDDDAVNNVRNPNPPKGAQTARKAPPKSNEAFAKIINDYQADQITDAIDAMKREYESVCSHYGVGSISQMTVDQYDDFMKIYENWKEKKANEQL